MLESLLLLGGKLLDKFIPDPAAKAEAQMKLAEMAQNGELAKMANETKLFETEQTNVSERWKADMSADSVLSKNIRPLSLIAVFSAYFIFAIGSGFGYNVNQAYVELLGQWGMLIMSAYFGGRTLEKIIELRSKK